MRHSWGPFAACKANVWFFFFLSDHTSLIHVFFSSHHALLFPLQRAAHSFQPQMKLEAVDKRSPGLIRVATVEEVETHRIKVLMVFMIFTWTDTVFIRLLAPSLFLLQVHYDGWSHVYDEWMDSDHPDIHPAGWCETTGHPLKVPPRDPKTHQPHGSCSPHCSHNCLCSEMSLNPTGGNVSPAMPHVMSCKW